MKIGLTYDLYSEYKLKGFDEEDIAEFDHEDTILAIESALKELGHTVDRVGNVYDLIKKINTETYKWDLVFNIAEGMYGFGREAQVPCILDAHNINYTFSDPVVLSLTLHKALTKRVVRDAGIKTPKFKLVSAIEDIRDLDLEFPVFIKPVAEGTGKGINERSKVTNVKDLAVRAKKILDRYKQAVLVEEYLLGREFTTGIIGTACNARVWGTMEIVSNNSEGEIYSYHVKKNYKEHIKYRIPEDDIVKKCGDMALKVWNVLGCKDAGRIDFKADANGELNFLEINPLAGLHPEDSDLVIMTKLNGLKYLDLIKGIISSAEQRIGIKQ
jgi:D-alanine-D-alanine ligase